MIAKKFMVDDYPEIAVFLSDILNDLEFYKLSIGELLFIKGYLDFMLTERIRELNEDFFKSVKVSDYYKKEALNDEKK
jgi:hypothetical protein